MRMLLTNSIAVAFCLLFSGSASSQEIDAFVFGSSQTQIGRLLIVTSNSLGTYTLECHNGTFEGNIHNVVIVDGASAGPATSGKAVLANASPGDRFTIVGQAPCEDGNTRFSLAPFSSNTSSLATGFTNSYIVEDDTLVVASVVDSFTDESGTYSEVEALVIGAGPPGLVTLVIYKEQPAQPGDRLAVEFSDDGWLLLVGD